MNYAAVHSIAWLMLLFLLFGIVQHLLMLIMYKRIFLRLAKIPYVSALFDRPTVLLHELVGHLIPAILSGSRIVGMDLHETKGSVSVKYEKNMFGTASVFIAGFGPTFFIPLVFIATYAMLNSYDIIPLIMQMDAFARMEMMLSRISGAVGPEMIMLVYLAAIMAPGAASSPGDVRSVLSFVRAAPLKVVFWGLVAVLVMYISHTMGFRIADYFTSVIIATFSAYLVMYSVALPLLACIVLAYERKGYIYAIAGFAAAYLSVAYFLPWFGYPLIVGLVFANVLLIAKGKK